MAKTPQRNELLYKIDYTTEQTQESLFCSLPNELLLEIGRYCFDGFGLEFWSHRSGKPRASSTVIRAAEDFDTNGLKILRLCKTARRKLLPLLASVTSHTLSVYSFTTNYGHTGLGQDYSGRIVPEIKLHASFCESIKTLEFCSAARLIPGLQIFKNLRCLRMHNSVQVEMHPGTSLDSETLTSICRYATGELETNAVVLAGAQLCEAFGDLRAVSWIHRLAAAVEELDTESQVEISITHITGRPWPWFSAVHDFRSNKVQIKVMGWEFVWPPFWKSPPSDKKRSKVLPTSV